MPANTRPRYIHAMRFASLTALYDPVVAMTSRERAFKSALLEGAALQAGQRVLDVGCGTGTLACMALLREPGLEMHGLDGDADILLRARRKAAQHGVSMQLAHGMSCQLPYPDQHFDSVLSSLFFHHLNPASKLLTLAEILRVLKPGGRLHICDWGAAQDPLMRALFLIIQLVDGFETTRESVGGKLPGMMAQTGFESIHVENRMRTMLGTLEIFRAGKAGSP